MERLKEVYSRQRETCSFCFVHSINEAGDLVRVQKLCRIRARGRSGRHGVSAVHRAVAAARNNVHALVRQAPLAGRV